MVMKSKESNWRFFSFAQTHAGKVRPYNEDAYLECTVEGVWVVADGMGGIKLVMLPAGCWSILCSSSSKNYLGSH